MLCSILLYVFVFAFLVLAGVIHIFFTLRYVVWHGQLSEMFSLGWKFFFCIKVGKFFFFPELSLASQRRVESIMLIAAAVRRTFTENSSLNVKSFSALTHTRDKAWVRVWLPGWLVGWLTLWLDGFSRLKTKMQKTMNEQYYDHLVKMMVYDYKYSYYAVTVGLTWQRFNCAFEMGRGNLPKP